MSIVVDGKGKQDRWTRYVEDLADALELRDWKIVFHLEPPSDPDAIGHCLPAYGRKVATIRVTPDLDREELRHTIVHELLHCHTDPAVQLVQQDLEELIEERVDRTFWFSFRRAFEYGVDGIATALAKHLPLPPEEQCESNDTQTDRGSGSSGFGSTTT